MKHSLFKSLSALLLVLAITLSLSLGALATDVSVAEEPMDAAGSVMVPEEEPAKDVAAVAEVPDEENVGGLINTNIPLAIRENDLVNHSALPTAYDARAEDIVPLQVRNQNPYGNCWSYSVLGQAEIYLLKNSMGSFTPATIDLSELQLSWNLYHTAVDPLGLTQGDSITYWGGSSYLQRGGNDYYAVRMLSQWKGSGTEEQCGKTFTNAAHSFDTVIHMENASFFSPKDTASIKQAILDYGSVTANYLSDQSNYNPETFGHYCSQIADWGKTTDHAVLIVGWDDGYSADNFNETPPGDGAWLVRNSWGGSWGDGGYFWLSYYDDSFLNSAECMAAEYELSAPEDNLYYYGGTAASTILNRTSKGGGIYGVGGIFTANSDEDLRAITLQTYGSAEPGDTLSDGTLWGKSFDYTLTIRSSTSTENPTVGKALVTKTGTVDGAGLCTIKLNRPVELKKGDVFSIDLRTYIGSTSSGRPISVAVDKSGTNAVTGCDYNDDQKRGQTFFRYSYQAADDTTKYSWSDAFSAESTIRLHVVTHSAECAEEPNIRPLDNYNGYIGDSVTLDASAAVSDGGALSWQWFKNGEAIPGATKPTYTPDTTAPSRYTYYAEVTNRRSGVRNTTRSSTVATVEVVSKAPPVVEAENTTDGISLTWGTHEYAEGYWVVRRNEAGVEEMFQCESNQYLDEDVNGGEWYTYRVQSIYADGELNSDLSEELKLLRLTTPSLTKISNGSGITVQWTAEAGAKTYVVYRKTTGKWSALYQVTGTSFTDKDVKSGTTYSYTIRAKADDIVGDFDRSGISQRYLAAPGLPTVSNTSTGVKVTWSKVTGATKYRLYRKAHGGSWTKLTDTTSTSYTDKTAKAGTTYYYTVCAMTDDASSSYNTKGIGILRLGGSTLSSAKSSKKKKLTVKWKKDSKATGYQVQYALKKNFSGAKTVTIKKNSTVSTTISKLSSKKTYYVRVRSYAKGKHGANSYSVWSGTKSAKVK